MRKDLIGINIGTGTIEILTYDKEIKLETPENTFSGDNFVAYTGIADLISNTLKENNVKQKKVALILKDDETFIKRITMPYMTVKQLEKNLSWDFKDLVGNNRLDYIYDYCFIDHTDTEMDLIGGAVKKALIEKYSDMFKTIGLKLVKATTRVMAITDLLGRIECDKDIAIVKLGFTKTKIDIYKNGFYHTTNTLDIGLKDMAKKASEILFCDEHIALKFLLENKDNIQSNPKLIEIYEDISTRVSRSINYYNYQNGDNTLDSLYYYGEASAIEPCVEVLSKNSSLPLKPVKDLFGVDNIETYALLED